MVIPCGISLPLADVILMSHGRQHRGTVAPTSIDPMLGHLWKTPVAVPLTCVVVQDSGLTLSAPTVQDVKNITRGGSDVYVRRD